MKHTHSLNLAFVGVLALFLAVSMLTACGGGDPNEKEAKALVKKNMESELKYDAPSAVVRAFFEALGAGKTQVAESFVEPDNLQIARNYINLTCKKAEVDSAWIAPLSYIWSDGNKAAVDYGLNKRMSFMGEESLIMEHENVLLVKNNEGVWKLRFENKGSQYATSIPDDINEQNDKHLGDDKDKYTVKL